MPVSSAMLQPRLFRESDPPMSRPTCAHIDLDALRHNLAAVRRRAPASRVMAVVKADGYGHGLERVANALQAADAFGVAALADAQRLRAAGLTQRIVLLSGRSEEHTSELQSLMRNSYAGFCL